MINNQLQRVWTSGDHITGDLITVSMFSSGFNRCYECSRHVAKTPRPVWHLLSDIVQALEKRTRMNKTKGVWRIVLLALLSPSGQPATRVEAANEGEAHILWLLAQREGHRRCRSTHRNKWEEFGVGANENGWLCCWQKSLMRNSPSH